MLLSLTVSLCILNCVAFDEPRIIKIADGERVHLSIDYCPVTIWDNSTANATMLLNYTAHCFCQYNPAYRKSVNCSVPGPTFKFRSFSFSLSHHDVLMDCNIVIETDRFTAGTTVHMTWYNRVQGSATTDEQSLNEYRDLSLFNMHTHGFHISFQEDNVRLIIPPQTSATYTYSIPADHYPVCFGSRHSSHFERRSESENMENMHCFCRWLDVQGIHILHSHHQLSAFTLSLSLFPFDDESEWSTHNQREHELA